MNHVDVFDRCARREITPEDAAPLLTGTESPRPCLEERTKLVILCLTLLLLLLAGCPRPVPPAVPTPPSAPCLVEPPPVALPVVLSGPDAGCPPSFVGCLDVDAALALEARLRASSRWERETWGRCGVAGDGGAK